MASTVIRRAPVYGGDRRVFHDSLSHTSLRRCGAARRGRARPGVGRRRCRCPDRPRAGARRRGCARRRTGAAPARGLRGRRRGDALGLAPQLLGEERGAQNHLRRRGRRNGGQRDRDPRGRGRPGVGRRRRAGDHALPVLHDVGPHRRPRRRRRGAAAGGGHPRAGQGGRAVRADRQGPRRAGHPDEHPAAVAKQRRRPGSAPSSAASSPEARTSSGSGRCATRRSTSS